MNTNKTPEQELIDFQQARIQVLENYYNNSQSYINSLVNRIAELEKQLSNGKGQE